MPKKEGSMKKLFGVRFLCLVTILTVTLVFAGINLLEAHRTPKDTTQWNARIPAESINLKGMDGGDYIYEDSTNPVTVSVNRSKRRGEIKYFIKFFIYLNDDSVWARFQDIFFDEWTETGDGKVCGFPSPHNSLGAPLCVESFMQDQQPLPGYEHLLVGFDIYTDIEDEALFPIGERISYMGPGDIRFYIWNSFECDNPDRMGEPWYHSVSGRVLALDCVPPAGFYITRKNENTWWIEVSQQDFRIPEFYCYEEWGEPKGKKGKREYTRYNYTPFEGTANLSYILELIKIHD
jgi:hypothetical protein